MKNFILSKRYLGNPANCSSQAVFDYNIGYIDIGKVIARLIMKCNCRVELMKLVEINRLNIICDDTCRSTFISISQSIEYHMHYKTNFRESSVFHCINFQNVSVAIIGQTNQDS